MDAYYPDRILVAMKLSIFRWINFLYLAISLVIWLTGSAAMAEAVAVVSSKSQITTLSKNQTADIFLGKTNRFPDGSKAVPVDQAEGSAIRDEFYTGLVGKSAAQMKAYWSKIIFTGRGQPPKEVSNGIEMKNFIADNPGAIGYIEQRLLDNTLRVIFQNDSGAP